MIASKLESIINDIDFCFIDGFSFYHGYDEYLISNISRTFIFEPRESKLNYAKLIYPNVRIENTLLSHQTVRKKDFRYQYDHPDFVDGSVVPCVGATFVTISVEDLIKTHCPKKALLVIKKGRLEVLENIKKSDFKNIFSILLSDVESVELELVESFLKLGFMMVGYQESGLDKGVVLFIKSEYISILEKENSENNGYLLSASRLNKKIALDLEFYQREFKERNITHNSFEQRYEKVRILRHFACSGGTLYSKCLSSMANTFLLSEVYPNNPFSTEDIKYNPSNLSELVKYSNFPYYSECQNEIFVDSILRCHEHVSSYGGSLILREHTHADYCIGGTINNNTIGSLLSNEFGEIINVVTVRNPIDSYLSLLYNDWIHFSPATFDEYCIRLKSFTDSYRDDEIFLYEDFVKQPKEEMKKICSKFMIEYTDDFMDTFSLFKVTGDSGRKSTEILPRARRSISEHFKQEILESSSFSKLCDRSIFKSYKDF